MNPILAIGGIVARVLGNITGKAENHKSGTGWVSLAVGLGTLFGIEPAALTGIGDAVVSIGNLLNSIAGAL